MEMTPQQIRETHRMVAEYRYELRPVVRGYSGGRCMSI
jgi:hypothetical protein